MIHVFGAAFGSGADALAILAAAQVVNVSMGSVAQILNMTGHEGDAARGMAVSTVTNVVLNLAFIPPWGMKGAAVATGISLILWNVLLAKAVHRRLKLRTTAFGGSYE